MESFLKALEKLLLREINNMAKSVILKGIVKSQPQQDDNGLSCGFFLGNLPCKVYSPSLASSVLKYISKGMTLRVCGRLSDLFFIAEHIEIRR